MLHHLELYSGIGGMRLGVRAALPPNIQHTVRAVDINKVANDVYRHNFNEDVQTRSIEHCSWRNLDIAQQHEQDEQEQQQSYVLWTLSPPCQPYTTTSNSKQQDLEDDRASSFSHLLELLPHMPSPPTHLLLENVPAFHGSRSYQHWRDVLVDLGYQFFDVLWCPSRLGLPHRRARHYTLARLVRNRSASAFSPAAVQQLGLWSHASAHIRAVFLPGEQRQLQPFLELDWSEYSQPLQQYSQEVQQQVQRYALPVSRVAKYYKVLDVVTPQSTHSNCFTKGYQKNILGCGSYLMEAAAAQQLCEQDSRCRWHLTENPYQHSSLHGAAESDPGIHSAQLLTQARPGSSTAVAEGDLGSLELQLAPAVRVRAFTPREVANLQGFPPSFSFPADVTDRQAYALLGNSVSVDAVSFLAKLLLEDVTARM